MSLFSTPKVEVPKEDPEVAASRRRAQVQADNSVATTIQEDLRRKMRSRLQTFGLVPNAAASAGGARPSVTSGFMARI